MLSSHINMNFEKFLVKPIPKPPPTYKITFRPVVKPPISTAEQMDLIIIRKLDKKIKLTM